MNKNRQKLFTYLIIIFFMAAGSAFAYKFDFVTVSDIVKNIKKTYADLESYQANFQIQSEKDGRRAIQTGVLKSKGSDKLLMEFSTPARQKIVSNGEMMWVYIPSLNVVAEQDLMSESGIFTSGSEAGLARLFNKYHYRFASKEEPETMPDGSKMYTLILKQKETRSGYRTIKLWVNESYFIVKAEGETSTGKKVVIILSNIKTNIDMPNGIFKFEIPASARLIKNPMISEE